MIKYTLHIKILILASLFLSCNSTSTINTSHAIQDIEAKTKPNIVFIVVDDLGYSDVEYINLKKGLKTPHINQLTQNGMVFTDAYAAAPVCSPTRASIMTGKSPAAVKVTCHIPGIGMETYAKKQNHNKDLKEAFFLDHLPSTELTIGEALKEQGYTTGYIGKWHLAGGGSRASTNGVVNAAYHPDQYGFDVNIAGCAYGQPASYFSPYKNGTIADGPKGEYLTDRLGDEAVKFIEQNKDTPFFLNLATYTVHKPLVAPKETVEKYNGNKYFAMIEKLDKNVGKVMTKLESLNLLENTIVVFYSDNGGLFGNAPLKGIKGTLNEGGIRVPLVVNWKGKVKSGSVCNTPVTSVDFFPTFIELAGENTSRYSELEGESIWPLLQGKQDVSERALYWHFPHYRREGLSMGAAIRKGKWKYIIGFDTQKAFLYNLEEDLSETHNLIDTHPDKAEDLANDLKKWQKSVAAEMPIERTQ
ncbi:sulfatase [Winogradskyella eckloniae]|uniref:sulfatase n=1 Tax=Winogradskyella eckloniae TaxID=1089306 RepID=UPI0015650E60|nr:sulfatase [Winogradskyella eckloniae]NRD20693.1 sulfatase [Winogradskyella eckloniae]